LDYELELAAVQIWLKNTANLNSWRRAGALPKLPRPVIVWESPYRGRKTHLNRYAYAQNVKLYGKLFINSVDEVLRLQNQLIKDLENRCGTLTVCSVDGEPVGYIKAAELTFKEAEGLDIPFAFAYEASYSRTRPVPIPPPLYVHTKVRNDYGDES
jgi:hypothetical protein